MNGHGEFATGSKVLLDQAVVGRRDRYSEDEPRRIAHGEKRSGFADAAIEELAHLVGDGRGDHPAAPRCLQFANSIPAPGELLKQSLLRRRLVASFLFLELVV